MTVDGRPQRAAVVDEAAEPVAAAVWGAKLFQRVIISICRRDRVLTPPHG
jgi:hypothetical protein